MPWERARPSRGMPSPAHNKLLQFAAVAAAGSH